MLQVGVGEHLMSQQELTSESGCIARSKRKVRCGLPLVEPPKLTWPPLQSVQRVVMLDLTEEVLTTHPSVTLDESLRLSSPYLELDLSLNNIQLIG